MPIAGLTTDRDASFPRLGKIRKGGVKTGNKPGKDLDYFRMDSDRPRVMERFREIYGPEPKEINVWLPYATVQECFDPWMKEYATGSLKRQCDGNNQVIWLEGKSYRGVYNDEAPIPCMKKVGKTCACKETGLLRVMVKELFQEGIIGYFDVETHSKWDIITLTSNLEAAYRLRPNLLGIPFVLRRTPQKISTPMGENSRSRVEKWLLTIEPDATWVAKQFQDMYQTALSGPGASIPALPPKPELILEAGDDEEYEIEEIEIETPLDRKATIDKIRSELTRIGWTGEQSKKLVFERYGKEATGKLDDRELSEYLQLLKREPDAAIQVEVVSAT